MTCLLAVYPQGIFIFTLLSRPECLSFAQQWRRAGYSVWAEIFKGAIL